MILNCTRCPSYPGQGAAYQNRVYGHGMRVHNPCGKIQRYRCTVCGTERDKGPPVKVGKKV